jgi:hypothetical protein
MGLGQYFRVVKRIVFVEIRAAKAFASCCGVNLAEGAFFGWAATSPTRLQPNGPSRRDFSRPNFS